MNNKRRKQDKVTQNYKIDQSSNQIPNLTLEITKASSDFITENVCLSASGWNVEQAKRGLDHVIELYNKLQNKKKKLEE